MELLLSRGLKTIVDDEDFEYLNQWKWHATSSKEHPYAIRNSKSENGKRRSILLHRVIMNTPEELEVDHISGNELDNRKINLRNVNDTQNGRNKRVFKTNILGIKGVSFQKYSSKSKTPKKNPFVATICINKRNKFLGSYKTILEASNAYKKAAGYYFGEYGKVN